jgi:predicted ATP-grasp superfamily ATP-dependent carboligase
MECAFNESKKWTEEPVLIPSEDSYVALAARFSADFGRHFRMNLPPLEVLERIEDKRFQYRAALEAGVPIPQTFAPANMEEVQSIEHDLRYPAFVKGAFAHLFSRAFSTKGFRVAGPGELREVYSKIFAAGVDAVVQSVIEGPVTDLVSACIYCTAAGEGKIAGEFAMRKVRQGPPGFGVGTMVESVDDPEVLELGRRLCSAIGYRGVAEVEFKRHPDDRTPRLIELNARLWEQTTLAVAAGVDFPYLLYRDLDDGCLPAINGYRLGIRWANLFEDLYLFRNSRQELGLTLAGWLRSWSRVRDVAFFAWDDPGPFLFRLWGFLQGLVRARLRPSAEPVGNRAR